MTHEVVPCHRRPLGARPEARSGHVSVAFGPCVYVWGGYHEIQVARWTDERYLPSSVLWILNTFTREWKKQNCTGQLPRVSSGSCAVLHGHHMYLFAGFTDNHENLNSLYKCDLKTFEWSRADTLPHKEDDFDTDTDDEDGLQLKKKKGSRDPAIPPSSMPSCRDKLCGWAYENCLYFFGGFGPRLDGNPTYLREDGIWTPDNSLVSQMIRGWNNQLVRFDLETLKWSSVPTRGPRPLPRAAMSAAIVGDRVYIFGGRHEATRRDDMNCLDMRTLEWTGELVPPPGSPRPSGRSWSSLSPVGDRLLFLYGGYDQSCTPLSDGFLYDVTEKRWTPVAQESLPDLNSLPLMPTPAWMEAGQPRPATPKGLYWHTAASLSCPPTAAAAPGVYIFGGMRTPIGQVPNLTFHSAHLLHFAFNPKSLTLLALEHIAHKILLKDASKTDPPAAGQNEKVLDWFESCLPRPLPFMLRTRVEALESIARMEADATRRPTQLPGLPHHPTDGAGGHLMHQPHEVLDDTDDSDDDDDDDNELNLNVPGVYHVGGVQYIVEEEDDDDDDDVVGVHHGGGAQYIVEEDDDVDNFEDSDNEVIEDGAEDH